MDLLNTKIKNILTEKTLKVRPENIKKDVTILGITGTLEEGTTPTGTIEITENGTVDVTNYASANVNVSGGGESEYNAKINTVITINNKSSITNNITEIPELDISHLTSTSSMFHSCSSLVKIPDLDTSNITNMGYMFYNCSSLVKFPNLDMSKVTNMASMFQGCTSVTEINLDLVSAFSKATNVSNMFSNCSSLVTINFGEIDNINRTKNIGTYTNMFTNCDKLNENTLNDILKLVIKLFPTTTGTLKVFGLSKTQAKVCETLSNYQAFLDAGWVTGY